MEDWLFDSGKRNNNRAKHLLADATNRLRKHPIAQNIKVSQPQLQTKVTCYP